jgi:hypothetical protein
MDLLEVFGEPLLELVTVVVSEIWTSGSWQSERKVPSLFGNDVWWNS